MPETKQKTIMTEESNPIGSIHVSPGAIATIAYHAALQSYGVVGLTSKNVVDGLTQVLVKDPTYGVDVNYDGHEVSVDLYVVIEYGTRITSVTNSINNAVRFQVEKALGMPINNINIHVQGLRVSDMD